MIELKEVHMVEVEEFIEVFRELYHHDFKGYSRESLRRRIQRLMRIMDCDSYAELKYKMVNHQVDRKLLLNEITVNTTEMFRDPEVFKYMTEEVFPQLATYPQIKVWHAASSSGEEVYSLAMLLNEYDLLNRTTQYATDVNSDVLKKAGTGIYSLKDIRNYTMNYEKAGGISPFSKYYSARYERVKFKSELRKKCSLFKF